MMSHSNARAVVVQKGSVDLRDLVQVGIFVESEVQKTQAVVVFLSIAIRYVIYRRAYVSRMSAYNRACNHE